MSAAALYSFPARPNTVRLGSTVDTLAVDAPGIAAAAGTPAAVAAAGGIATAAGAALSVAIPVAGAIIGAFIGGLLANHAKRVAGAKNENAALNQLVPAIQQSIITIADAYSSGKIDASGAQQALQAVAQDFWTKMGPFETNPGQAGGPGTCLNNGSQMGPAGTPMTHTVPCDKSHTASTCVGCIWIENYVDQLSQLIQAGKSGTFQLQGAIPGNKYGFTGAPALSVTLSAPSSITPQSITADQAASLASDAGSLLSASIFGIPIALILGGLIVWKVVF